MQDYHEFLEEILISEAELQKRIAELGEQISQDYQGKELLLVCILRGGVMFLTDLMRHISIPHMIDFMSVSSYGVGARRSRGQSRITLDINTDIHNMHVLLIEDIVDSGFTVKAVLELLSGREPKSLKVCALLDKVERREVEVPIDYHGFIIPDKFVFGYGLDADEYYRNLPFIGILAAEKYDPDA
ncbi:MAG: hypoxanthine phosphoribosyltransferase [Anaerolineales bacterium]|nr:hypoxanthine phosphoribosyltransferase [Anaerolineae bacterium]PWB54895.1 MAG: hypoxanthine phosphoribosyltransferase [Anaerolineales bacterium]